MNTERTPALRRIARYLVVAVVVGGVLIAAFTFGYVADIRPDTVRDGISEDEAARGRQLVADVARRHGAEAWRTPETLEVDVTDEWIGLMTPGARALCSPTGQTPARSGACRK